MAASMPMTPSADEELLIEEALRQRRSQRSGRSLACVLALAAFLAVAGLVLGLHPGTITYGTPYSSSFPLGLVLSAFGALSLAAAVVAVLGAVNGARPRAPWGDPAPGECPDCGHPALRRDDVVRWEGSNTLKAAASGTVTLCETPGCQHAAALPGPR